MYGTQLNRGGSHKGADAKIYSSTQKNEDYLRKFKANMSLGASIVFTPEAVIDNFLPENDQSMQIKCWS